MRLFSFIAITLAFQYCWAALGGEHKNLTSEHASIRAARVAETKTTNNYSVVTQETGGQTINQYVNSDGKIFAVTWRGTTPPDLSVLLGDHYTDYQSERRSFVKAPGRKPLTVRTSKIVVRHSGHMRDLRGVAYQASLVPTGVDPEALP